MLYLKREKLVKWMENMKNETLQWSIMKTEPFNLQNHTHKQFYLPQKKAKKMQIDWINIRYSINLHKQKSYHCACANKASGKTCKRNKKSICVDGKISISCSIGMVKWSKSMSD